MALTRLQMAINTARRTLPQRGGILAFPLDREDPDPG
jgi:hypothetical protein